MAEESRKGDTGTPGAGEGQDRQPGVPPHNEPAEEWGQRQGTGEQIESGGKAHPGPSTPPTQR